MNGFVETTKKSCACSEAATLACVFADTFIR
jgi:hypothetical protein